MAAKLPLEGVRILDITVAYAGPYATMLLGDWGAEVIRIESTKHFAANTRGQVARPSPQMLSVRQSGWATYPDSTPGQRPWNRFGGFHASSRNKLSMTVDMTRPEGQEVLERLVRVSDGFIENNAPAAMDRQGITWERLSAINPRLILVRMPAFGLSGPYRNLRAYGGQMQAIAGLHLIRAYPDLDLSSAPMGLPADYLGGICGAIAFVMGYRYRQRTGKGIQVEASSTENVATMLGEFVLDYSMNGRVAEPQANDDPSMAPHNAYPCRGNDRWITIACRNDRDWQALCRVVGDETLAQDERFSDALSRWKNRRDLDRLMARWTVTQDPIELAKRLQEVGVPSGAVMDEEDIFADPQLQARGFWQGLDDPEAGTHRYVTHPWKASNTPNPLRRHPPLLGQDNEYIYKTLLGFSDQEYKRFEELGHIGTDYDPSIP